MPSNPGIIPLDWPALVQEAIRRRKEEKLTQKEHANLASVSAPTIIAFDRGEITLSLSKAFAILSVVGLLDQPGKESAQDNFAKDAFARWRELTSKAPTDSPARFPHGYYKIDYALEGELKDIELHKFPDILRQATTRVTGWPMFRLPNRAEYEATEVDGTIECWMPPASETIDRISDAAHCDFWRGCPEGRMFLIRGYQEDSQETFAAGTIFDVTLPMWRVGETLIHACRLAHLIGKDPKNILVKSRFHYTGLLGRALSSWASPGTAFIDGGVSKSDEAVLESSVTVEELENNLARHVTPIVASLFERFGLSGTNESFVDAELSRMRKNRF